MTPRLASRLLLGLAWLAASLGQTPASALAVNGVRSIEVTRIVTSSGLPGVVVLERSNRDTINGLTEALYSLNAGRQWSVLPLSPTRYASLVIAPRAGSGNPVRFAGGYGNGFVRTGDWGASWAVSPLGRTALCGHVVEKVWASPRDGTHLFALASCTWYPDEVTTLTTYTLWRSTDAGLAWIEVAWPPIAMYSSWTTSFLSIGASLYVIGWHPGSFDDPSGVAVYASSDEGLTWSRVAFVQTNSSAPETVAVTASLADAQRVYLLIVRSEAGVRTVSGYTHIGPGPGPTPWAQNPCLDPETLIADPLVAGRLLLACKTGLWRSQNDGATWEKLAETGGQAIALDLGTPGRTLWARADGFFASPDFGTTWSLLADDYRNGSLFLPAVLRDR